MNRGNCEACEKPLVEQAGPVVMEGDGHRYHFECWRTLMDARIKRGRESTGERGVTDRA